MACNINKAKSGNLSDIETIAYGLVSLHEITVLSN